MNKNGLFGVVFLATLLVSVFVFLLLIFSIFKYIDWYHFLKILFSKEILFALKLSLLTSSVASISAMLFALPVSYALSRFSFPGKDIIDTIFDVPIILSPIAIGAILIIFLNNTSIGAFIENKLLRFTFEIPGIILAQFIVVSALAIRLLKSTFDSVDVRYEKVIRTLGATRFQTLLHVTIPMAKHGIFAAFVITWARAMGEFGATVTLAGATTMKTETLPVAIFLSFARADVQQAMIVILILLLLSVMVLLVVRRVTKELVAW